ncbi:recombinase family protein [Neobacillus vireti]|uniref:recombinase family protein n=1 Tax=Neobacillus vireti TaxID=220686 RepID=UPI002FFE1A73
MGAIPLGCTTVCRVSTEEQASEGYSISAQLHTLRQYAYLYGWQISEEYVDEGISGGILKVVLPCKDLYRTVKRGNFKLYWCEEFTPFTPNWFISFLCCSVMDWASSKIALLTPLNCIVLRLSAFF